jgi:RNA polymerase sigma factor (sigma-70 family)
MDEKALQYIILGCVKKDRRSQELLYQAFFGYGTTLAFHYVNDVEQAKAIYNDAMFKAFKNIEKYRQEASFKTWLHRIVVNAAIDYHKRFYAFRSEDIEQLLEVEQDTQNIENQLFEKDILGLVQQITPSYRSVFLLHVMEEFTFKEIAEHLNMTEGGAKTLYHKAKLRLKDLVVKHLIER